jgi:hypothetical protein
LFQYWSFLADTCNKSSRKVWTYNWIRWRYRICYSKYSRCTCN